MPLNISNFALQQEDVAELPPSVAIVSSPNAFVGNGASAADTSNLIALTNSAAFDAPHTVTVKTKDTSHQEFGGVFGLVVSGAFASGYPPAGGSMPQVALQSVINGTGATNAWLWGGSALAQSDQDSSTGGGVWGFEADINIQAHSASYGFNNSEQNTKALSVASGGTNKPQTGVQVINGGASTAGFIYGLRFQQTGGIPAVDTTGVYVLAEVKTATDIFTQRRLISGTQVAANAIFQEDAQGTHQWGPPDGSGALDTNLQRVGAGIVRVNSVLQIGLGSGLRSGSGAPAGGSSGDYYFRTDTPGTANQRIYVNNAGTWTGIV